MRMPVKCIRLGLGAVVAGALAWWIMRPTSIVVEVGLVDEGPLEVTVDGEGVARHRRHETVAAPIPGRFEGQSLRPGDTVSVGTVVAVLHPAPLDPRARAEAGAAVASAGALRREAGDREAQARIALDEARRARDRAERLAEAGGLAQADLEAAVAQAQFRERDLGAARARVQAATEDERRARSALLDADPVRASARGTLRLRASMAGSVLRVFEEHERVVPAGVSLIEIGDPLSLEIVTDVLTRDAVAIVPGARMKVRIGGGAGLEARVTRVEPAAFTRVSPLGIEEQRVNVIGALAGPAVALGDQFEVETSIVTWEAPRVLRVPLNALVPIDTSWAVFVASDRRARLRPVQVGHRGVRHAEITSGVRAGEVILQHPDERVGDGTRIQPMR